jgi:CDP-diacylglycerol--glycerol-3-phosphate 3-phosphatidyltransferase
MPRHAYQIHAPRGLWPLTWPMGLTMLRMLLLPVFLWVLLYDAGPAGEPRRHRWWAMGIFAVMAVTDKLDGYLARRLNQTSQLGTLLDPVADKLLIACSTILLSFPWVASPGYRIPIPVVAAIYLKDVIVVVGSIALMAKVGKVTVRARFMGKLSTFLQLGLVIATLIGPDIEGFHKGLAGSLLRSLWWMVAGVAAVACLDYIRQGIRQAREGRTTPGIP